jgi:SAM-dependent methyltransferase
VTPRLTAAAPALDRLHAVALYDRIGTGYAQQRRADPRITAAVQAALGDARTVVNVGAGAGSYEPSDRTLVAVEPSATMRAQRPPGAATCLNASAESLPLPDSSFDAAMAIYTDFHWADPARGIAEMVRVSTGRVVVLTVDRCVAEGYWLTRDYLPGANDLFRPLSALTADFPSHCEVVPVPIPHDCVDGFAHAFWRRPHRVLEAQLHSTFAIFERLPEAAVEAGLERLRTDLDDGTWERRNARLCGMRELDLGHRLIVWRHPARLRRDQPTFV